MNDFIQLKPQSNVYDAETIVEGRIFLALSSTYGFAFLYMWSLCPWVGTLEGFSFESDDEADKMPKSTHQTDQNNGTEEQSKGKTKGKAAKTVTPGTSTIFERNAIACVNGLIFSISQYIFYLFELWIQGVLRRKGKAVGGKPVKKVRKKSQVPKKGTARKWKIFLCLDLSSTSICKPPELRA